MDGKFTIGLFMAAENEGSRRYVEGLLKYVAKHPNLKIADVCYLGDELDMNGLPPWTGKADGVITSIRRAPGLLQWLRRGGAPIVCLTADLRKDMISVFTNPRSVARLAVEHLHGLGLRNFAYVGYRHADGSFDRERALAKELARHELQLRSYHTDSMLTGTYSDFTTLDDVEPELLSLVRDAPIKTLGPLAVVAVHDSFAAGVCRIVHALGLTIPSDVAVLGVRDLEAARVSTPPLSSIRLNEERLCYEAAGLLHRLLQGEKLPRRSVQLPALELVERESTIGKQKAAATDVQRALEYIRQNACSGIRIQDVANHVYMSLRTFELQFAAATGRTVGEEIRDVRLERAKYLLKTTNLPVSSVARLLAMNKGSDLNNFFRRWTGTTPLNYRRQCKPGA